MILDEVYATLRTLVADRVYPAPAPAGTVAPYITYQTVSAEPVERLADAPLGMRHSIQVDCWAKTMRAAVLLGDQVVSTVYAAPAVSARLGGADNGHEPDTGLYRASLDFDWWETAP